MNTSFGPWSEERENMSLSLGSIWRAETAPSCVSGWGVNCLDGKDGCVVDSSGVSGIGRTKSLLRAWSPAVR